ncbi:hypothetical protein SAMN05444358_1142 [Ruegeria halocynthiae]|uniref:Secreted protein n=1 Tax=Ruegeria halocynthiae TaxID=985054 RepID=A0A1H3F9S1_9RHOB|nr:hypothetical protein [Ruegeria halocynthiae]SDX87793.1 hypothetical protein SAMN05444358_1142 [Ruegeria halocynthiae]
MTTSICFVLRRMAFLTTPIGLAVSTLAASQAMSQEQETPNLPPVSYSYITEDSEERQFFDLGELSKSLSGQEFSLESVNSLSAKTVDDLEALRDSPPPFIERLLADETTAPLAEGLFLGGMSSAAAIAILNVTSIGKEKCKALGKELYGAPTLGSSSMRAVQNAIHVDTGTGLGRGEFDIRTTKFVMCRDPMTNTYEGVPINVRWTFNVNGKSLQSETTGNFSDPPPNNGNYKQRFLAEGLGIQLVLMVIDGTPLPPDNLAYLVVQDACIDIWFVDEVSGPDIWVPVSMPGSGVFCAGGYCKDVPPRLDATQ